ncbi:hypothetical protein B0H16DRAFT_1453295 [Mycena metata]|uniref:Uncharacterized protein n=1 Tax=Mycena metata TaxID=1033252 RepID=A0AAD7NM84_9AGAR|nr:hypothetical protein B0H16DRAFT_1453295 [Mycena metata]
MGRFIFPVFGLLSLATGSLSLNIVVSSLAGLAISQCGTVTFRWIGGQAPYTIALSRRLALVWCLMFSDPSITSTTILSPIDMAGTKILGTGVTLSSYTVLVDVPAGTTAYFVVSDSAGDAAGSSSAFTVLSSSTSSNDFHSVRKMMHVMSIVSQSGQQLPHYFTNVRSLVLPRPSAEDPQDREPHFQYSPNIEPSANNAGVKRRNGRGKAQTTTAGPSVLESAGPKETAVSSMAPPMQLADTNEKKFQPSVELSGHKIATPISPVPRGQEGQASVQELAYDEQTPSQTMVTTNPTSDQFSQKFEFHSQVEHQGRTITTITPGQPKFPSCQLIQSNVSLPSSDSKTIMSWDPRASVHGSTSGIVGSYASMNVLTDG